MIDEDWDRRGQGFRHLAVQIAGMCSWHQQEDATRQNAIAFRLILSYSAFGVLRVVVIKFDLLVFLFAVLAYFGAFLCAALLFEVSPLLCRWWTRSRTALELPQRCNF